MNFVFGRVKEIEKQVFNFFHLPNPKQRVKNKSAVVSEMRLNLSTNSFVHIRHIINNEVAFYPFKTLQN